MSYLKLLAIAAAVIAVAPSSLIAQACTGNHAVHGQGRLSVGVSFTEGAIGYGVSGGGRTNGPLFVGAGYSRVDFDNSDLAANSLSVAVGAEVSGLDFSLCPVVAFGFAWFSNVPFGADLDSIEFDGGLLVGKSFGESLLITPHASATVIHIRATASLQGEDVTVSDTGAAFGAGFTLGNNAFYGGPSVSITTFEGSDPVFSIGVGVAF